MHVIERNTILSVWPPTVAARTGYRHVDDLAHELGVSEVWLLANAGRAGERLGSWLGPRITDVLMHAVARGMENAA